MNAILPKMEHSLKRCQHVVFGPWKHLDIGAWDLSAERGMQQTLLLLKHIHTNQDLSTLFGIGLKCFRLHTGIARPILEGPDLKIPCLEVGWFRALQNFLCLVNAKTHLEMGRVSQIHPREQSCTDGSIPCAPTMHLEMPVPIEPLCPLRL
jgi:hypothetical protein